MKVLFEIISDHVTCRRQIMKLAKADLIKTYRGSALGWAWALVQPITTILVFWFAISIGLKKGGDVNGYPFFLWLVAGFIPWFYMKGMITGGAACLRTHKYLVTKLKFPVTVIPTFVSLSKLSINLILQFIMMMLFVFKGYMPDLYYLQLPLYVIMMFLWFTLWGIFAGTLSAISKDFLNLVKAFSTAIFWMSGIIYDVNRIDIPWVKTVLSYNPVTIVATGYRNSLINKVWFFEDFYGMRCYLIVLAVILILALHMYKKHRREIPDVM